MENFLETNSNEIQNLTNKTSTTSIADLYNKNESSDMKNYDRIKNDLNNGYYLDVVVDDDDDDDNNNDHDDHNDNENNNDDEEEEKEKEDKKKKNEEKIRCLQQESSFSLKSIGSEPNYFVTKTLAINEIKDQSLNKEDNLPFLQRSSQKSLNTKTNLVSIDERNSFEKSYSTLNGPGTGPGIGLGTSTESNDSRHLQSSLISSSLQNQQTIITKSSQYTIMIDDLFIRKLLFQICPKYFNQNWLEKFKTHYISSFNETNSSSSNNINNNNSNNNNNNSNRQRQIDEIRHKFITEQLDLILSTNQFTKRDKLFVFWRMNSLENSIESDERLNNDIDQEDCLQEIREETIWLQSRDPMTYLYHFCELLMFIEGKFFDLEKKNLCQQLAREIRAYLFYISKDDRFKENSFEQEQLLGSILLKESRTDLCNGLITESNLNKSSKIFCEISDFSKAGGDDGKSEKIIGQFSAEQRLFYSILKHLMIICHEVMLTENENINDFESKYSIFSRSISNLFVESKPNEMELVSNQVSKFSLLYDQWIEYFNEILISLRKHYKQKQASNHLASIDINGINNGINNGESITKTFDESLESSLSLENQSIVNLNSTSSNLNCLNMNYFADHPFDHPKTISNCGLDEVASFLAMNSVSAIGSFNNTKTNTSIHSTQVERNSSTASSGPSSGVGSLDSHPSSSFREVFTGGGGSGAVGNVATGKLATNLQSSTSLKPSMSINSSSNHHIVANVSNEIQTNTSSQQSFPIQLNNYCSMINSDGNSTSKLLPNSSMQSRAALMNKNSIDTNQIIQGLGGLFPKERATIRSQQQSQESQFKLDSDSKLVRNNNLFIGENNSCDEIHLPNGGVKGCDEAQGNFYNDFAVNSLFSPSFTNGTSDRNGKYCNGRTVASVNNNPIGKTYSFNDDALHQSSNQSYPITLENQENLSKLASTKGTLRKFIPQPVQTTQISHQTSSQSNGSTNFGFSNLNSPFDELCEKQTLYRLIIGQLLFDGHRNIACQVAVSEHIKCDSFLIGPSQELHKLVTFAKAKKKEDILIDPKSIDSSSINSFSGFPRATSAGSFYEIGSQHTLPVIQQNSSHVLHRIDSFDHRNSASHLGFISNESNKPLFSSNDNDVSLPSSTTQHTSQSNPNSASILDYSDLNDSTTDLYSPTSGPIDYYLSNQCPDVLNATIFSNDPNDLINRSMNVQTHAESMKCLPTIDSGPNDSMLTENGLIGLNRLTKMNTVESTAGLNSAAHLLLGNHSNSSLLPGRSASAMAMTSLNGTNFPSNNLIQSPIGMKSPTIQSNSSLGSSLATSNGLGLGVNNGKNHQIMQIVYKFGSLGQLKSQFSSPHGFCLGMNDEIIIADTNNHRICVYDKCGVFKQMFGNPGKDEGQLWYPRKITMIPPSFVRNTLNIPYYVICDRGMERSRMQIFTRNGNFVRKIPIRYIDIVAGIAINSRGQIVVVDSVSPTIYVITIDNGTLVEWRDCGDYMREPSDIAIHDDNYYICDFKGHCVVVISSGGEFIRKIGMDGLTSFPNGIDISPNGDIFVGDSHGNKFHVVVFNRDGRLLAEYECPYCKVSRCCGLKLTKDNNIVTLAKNNHHVLVLNPNFPHHQSSQSSPQIQ